MNRLGRRIQPSIRAKLIISVMSVHIVLMTLFVVDMVNRQKEFLLSESTSSALKQASLTADAASSWVLSEDVAGMAEVLQSSRSNTPTRYALIMDTRGQVLAHTDRSFEGRFVSDPESIELLTGHIRGRTWRSDNSLIQAAAPIVVERELLGWVMLGLDTAPTYAHLRDISVDGVMYTLAAMAAGAFAAWLLARYMLRQLGHILEGVDRMRKNALDTPIPVTSRDEIGYVADALNRAMESLRRSREEIKREMQERHQAERRIHYLSRRLMDGSEEERKRIGHDLHDELGQSVTGFQFGLHSLQDLLPEDAAPARELCEKLVRYAEEMGETVSRIATNSWPVALEHLGLGPAAEAFAEECAMRHQKLSLSFKASLPEERLEPRLELACYRILQESLHNIIRHSGAKNADVSLKVVSGTVVLRIQDDGQGFDAQEVIGHWQEEFSGIGLIGMNERAVAHGGHLEVRSSPGKGSVVEAFLPVVMRKSPGFAGRGADGTEELSELPKEPAYV